MLTDLEKLCSLLQLDLDFVFAVQQATRSKAEIRFDFRLLGRVAKYLKTQNHDSSINNKLFLCKLHVSDLIH